eukprot:TRINITY_DN5740_c0_g1_i4.p1 TRINITY_DN5740_c0_g1~~TRINITY_DN5740_c0_g1_i4.p1  ORF type:complete len:336 (+),score=87.27 TRINITY_DN5740_c0_g1_i4:152-1159(+)
MWRVLERYEVGVMFCAPTAFRAVRREDPEAALLAPRSMPKFRSLFLAGERADSATIEWAEKHLKVPVRDHFWQTESGWPIISYPGGYQQLEPRAGSSGKPVPGYSIQILNPKTSQPAGAGELGDICIRTPLPPGWFVDLVDCGAERYFGRHRGYYETGDAGMVDADGYVHVMSRTDDVINVAGHRLSTGDLEETISSHPTVAECAVIGVEDEVKGMVPVAFAVLRGNVERTEELDEMVAHEIVQLTRQRFGPVASMHTALIVSALPKTRSGKVLRRTLRQMMNGESVAYPATIDNPATLAVVGRAIIVHQMQLAGAYEERIRAAEAEEDASGAKQ